MPWHADNSKWAHRNITYRIREAEKAQEESRARSGSENESKDGFSDNPLRDAARRYGPGAEGMKQYLQDLTPYSYDPFENTEERSEWNESPERRP